MVDPQDRLIRYLQDAHAAELGSAEVIEGFVNETDDGDVAKVLFEDHLAVTRSQASRLEDRLQQLNAEPSSGKGVFNSLMSKVTDIIHGSHDEYDRVTLNLIKAYAIEHLEQGMYSSLITYAEACGDEATALLGEEIKSEEEEAALKIFPMIEQCAQRTFDATTTL